MPLIKSNLCKLLLGITAIVLGTGVVFFALPKATKPVTYNQDIAQIINDNCVECHRPGEIGPMPLQSYQEVVPYIRAIEHAIKIKKMPPWHASPTVGKFSNDRSLTEVEYQKLLTWIDSDYPEGTGNAPSKTFSNGWQIGTPDVEFTLTKPVNIPERGEVDYQYQIVPTNFTEDKWISAAEIRPEQRGHAHHVIVSVLPADKIIPPIEMGVNCPQWAMSPQATKHNEDLIKQGREIAHLEGKYLVGWGVGVQFDQLPKGAAILVPAGSRLLFQLHYVSNGTAAVDTNTRIGLKFADYKVTQQVNTLKVQNHQFVIPPRVPNYEATACYTLTEPVTLLEIIPHMHLRGKDFSFKVVYPDGRMEALLYVPHYQFEWQTVYRLAKPLKLPIGTKLDVVAHFDNSTNNPHNPNPDQEVYFGEQSDDEMLIGFVVVMTDVPNSQP